MPARSRMYCSKGAVDRLVSKGTPSGSGAEGFRACPRAMPVKMARTIITAATERFWKNFIGSFLCLHRLEVRRVRPAHQIVDGYLVIVR